MVCAGISFFCLEAQGKIEPGKTPAMGRSDLIKIDTLATLGKLELPPVTFFHDKHTEALLKEQKNCETCHAVEDNKLSLAYMRKKTTRPAEMKDIYHSSCIGCHNEMFAAGKKTGPLDGFCRSCHNAEPPITAARLDAGMDKVLHFRHVDSKAISSKTADKDNCSSCHHEYDKQAKKISYAKGKEESCRYCHQDKPKDGVMSREQASHQQCVLCHLDLANKGAKETGPYLCAGCHSAEGQARVDKKDREVMAKLKDKAIPRLGRGQPDAVLLTPDPKLGDPKVGKPVVMNPVAFDHKAHEKSSDSCRTCHHASLDKCEKCHTLTGAKEGNFVTFEQSMHLKSSRHSCVGCHTAKQADPKCAGCHDRIAQTSKPEDANCRQCHLSDTTLQSAGAPRDNLGNMSDKQKSGAAAIMLKSRTMNAGAYAATDIPEKVVMNQLVDKYEAVEFSHRQHVQFLMKGMKGNALAEYFHRDPGTMCQGCHHNSPASKNPPSCASCHGKTQGKTAFDPREANRPGLLAALHGQCMSCHQDMGVVKPAATACTECHKEKKK
jgi:hypothetical protein